MTTCRRFSRRFAAGCVLASGLATGCANSSQFTAGRLPYGGAQTASAGASTQDPFLARAASAGPRAGGGTTAGQAFGTQALAQDAPGQPPAFDTGGAAPTRFAPDGVPRQGANPYETAYLAQPADNPFAAAQTPDGAEWVSFETAPADSDPFAEVAGQPPVPRYAPSRTSGDGMPQITPGGTPADPWQPRPSATTSHGSEEFLPPVQ